MAKPFLRWAGGKRWLVARGMGIFPRHYNNYFEPFLGSGAVFFKIKPQKAILSDKNSDLIDTYSAIKQNWELVVKYLQQHHLLHSKEYYYSIRLQKPRGLYQRAARFIYLNRTCWNGLYRVNLEGTFNVPIGTKKLVLLPNDDFEAVSRALQSAEIKCDDFEKLIDEASSGDLVYVDPPYTVNHSNNGFVKYNNVLFSWADQERLKDAALRAIDRGAKIVISNAYHDTIKELYPDSFHLYELSRATIIAGKNCGRGLGKELLITGGY